jgi:hypothetical protein
MPIVTLKYGFFLLQNRTFSPVGHRYRTVEHSMYIIFSISNPLLLYVSWCAGYLVFIIIKNNCEHWQIHVTKAIYSAVYSAFQSSTNNLFFPKFTLDGAQYKTWPHNSWNDLLFYPPPNDIVPKFHARWSALLNLDFEIVLFHRLLDPVAQLSLSEGLR